MTKVKGKRFEVEGEGEGGKGRVRAQSSTFETQKRTDLGQPPINEPIDPFVASHIVSEPDLNDLVFRNGRRDGREEVGEGMLRRQEEILSCLGRRFER